MADNKGTIVRSSTAASKKKAPSTELTALLSKLRPFQREAYDFATQGIVSPRLRQQSTQDPSFQYDPALLGKGRILLADEMGLGKTVTSLAIMAHYKQEWPLLILCPASLRHMWPGEIEKFLPTIPPSSVYVLNGFNDVGFQNRKDVQVVVATYSLLQDRSAVAQLLKSKTFQFNCIICDESHNLKQKNSQRSKLALPILQSAKRLICLSGTPALARPVELWLQLHVLAPKLFGKYTDYTKTYCDAKRKFGHWDVNGLSNAKELHTKLKQVMVRRLKCDVLQELPAKQRSIVPITITDKGLIKENQQRMKELRETRLSVADLVGDDQRTASFEAKSLFNQAYQASGIAKAQAVADYLVDWVAGAGTQKVLVFAHHKAVLDTLELAISKHLKGVGHIRIDGSVPANERSKLVRKFQQSAQVRVAILSMTAAGVGLTLTAASNVMFAELHYTPGVLGQAEDRAHRIGQRNAVNIMYFICKDPNISVDSQIWNMLSRKIGNLEQIIDGGTGKERAALAAKEVEGNDPNRPRQSGTEELSSFFAETAANEKGQKKQTKVATKGSILSFFKKASETPSATKSKKSSDTSSATKSKVPPSRAEKQSPSDGSNTNQRAHEMVEWACKTCTFINSKKRATYLACGMCHTMYVEEDYTGNDLPMVTPMQSNQRPKKATPKSNLPQASKQSSHRSPMVKSGKGASAAGVIVIDDDKDNGDLPPDKKLPKRKAPPPDEVVVIDVDSHQQKKPKRSSCPPKCESKAPPKKEEMLTFSVSKNSGRITLHYKEANASSFANFDVHDILTEETISALEDAQTKRFKFAEPTSIGFKHDAVLEVIQKLDHSIVTCRAERKQCCKELEAFVTSYLALREVERKALKDSGDSFSSQNLAQCAARVLTAAASLTNNSSNQQTGSSNERYSGGAKERAEERLKAGTASRQDMDILKGDNCAWCGESLSHSSRLAKAVYCSQPCAETGRIRRGGIYASSRIRDQVFALEGGVCQLCGVDAHALYRRVLSLPPAQRLSVLCNAHWKLPKTHKALERLLQEPNEGSFWQADHVQAVAEGGGGCGMENLRTLCVPCHTSETEKLRGRLKLSGGTAVSMDDGYNPSSTNGSAKTKQADIRDSFSRSVAKNKC